MSDYTTQQGEKYTIQRGFYRGRFGWWISGGSGDTAWTTWSVTLAAWENPSADLQEDVVLGADLKAKS